MKKRNRINNGCKNTEWHIENSYPLSVEVEPHIMVDVSNMTEEEINDLCKILEDKESPYDNEEKK